jgi:flavin reductase (DIM6/NTAB) family NADH-FMN oxidoreductase RutF
VVVHLLGADHVHLAKTFATGGIDRFADHDSWSRLVTGEPVLAGAPTWLRGRIVERMEAGDSTVVAVQVLQAQTPEPEETPDPLVYHNRAWHRLGEQSVLA